MSRSDQSKILWIVMPLFSLIAVGRAFYFNRYISFYGENFTDLLLGAVEFPPRIFAPLLDGVFLIPRILAFVASLFGPELIADAAMILSCLFHVYCGTFILRSGFEWLLPSVVTRLLFAVLITFGLGADEIIGNLVCASYDATWLLLLLLLREGKSLFRDKLLFVAGCFSTNLVPIVLPLLALRMQQTKQRLFIFYSFVVFSSIGTSFFIAQKIKTSIVTWNGSNLSLSFQKVFSYLLEAIGRIVTEPSIETKGIWFLCGSAAVICIILLLEEKTPKRHSSCCLGLIAVSLFFCFLHAIGRPYSLGGAPSRHGLIIFGPIVLSLAVFLSNIKNVRFLNSGSRLLSGANLFLLFGFYIIVPSTPHELADKTEQWTGLIECARSFHPVEALCRFDRIEGEGGLTSPSGLLCLSVENRTVCTMEDYFEQVQQYTFAIK